MNTFDQFGLDPFSYSIAIELATRLLGLIYIIAYIPFLFQVKGLFGKEGIRPIADFLEVIKNRFGKKRFYYAPTLFWLNASDQAQLALIYAGIILGALLALGIFPPIILILLYLTHLSLTNAGQEFLSFGWETFLLELTIGFFLIVSTTPFNVFGWLGLNVLLFRFYLQAGVSKIFSQDENWRNLTALSYHYLTQPIPNTQAWFFHKFPMRFHKISAVLMFFIEIVVPFAIFGPPEFRLVAFILFTGLQLNIWFTGNFSYLNYVSIVSGIILIHNSFLNSFITFPQQQEASPLLWQVIISLLGLGYFALQVINCWQTFIPNHLFRRLLIWWQPFHLCYQHGIFAVMTTKRYEIIIEGSQDGEVWKEYHFYHKPGDVARRPRRIAPYQPRIDWQVWFLPFGYFWNEGWFQAFLVKLLEGSSAVLKLLKVNPFPDQPPLYIRCLIYDYEYTSFEEKKESGHWWKRKLIGQYAPIIRLYTEAEQQQRGDFSSKATTGL